MPVSGRVTWQSEPLVTEWLLNEISTEAPRNATSSGFVEEQLRSLVHRELSRHRELSSFENQWSTGNTPSNAVMLPPLPILLHQANSPSTSARRALGAAEVTSESGFPCPLWIAEDTDQGEGTDEDKLDAACLTGEDYSMPEACSFLSVGQDFSGVQRCSKDNRGQSISQDTGDWKVSVQIHGYAPESGYICGIMEANVSPDAPVVTFWEGEIVDNENFTFITKKWAADHSTDITNWSRFQPFQALKQSVVKQGGQSGHLKDYPFVFMRWKEKFFVSQQENSQLTIQGFYYVCMSRQDGHVWGYYYDPESQPYQELELKPQRGRHGYGFSSYELR